MAKAKRWPKPDPVDHVFSLRLSSKDMLRLADVAEKEQSTISRLLRGWVLDRLFNYEIGKLPVPVEFESNWEDANITNGTQTTHTVNPARVRYSSG